MHPKFGTPYVAVLLVAAMGIAFVLLQTFEKLTDTYVIAVLPFYALGVAAVFPLRKKLGYAPSFKTPWYPVVPLLFIASTIFLLGNSVIEPDTRIWTLGIFAVILAGIPFYWFVSKKKGRGVGDAEPGTAHVARTCRRVAERIGAAVLPPVMLQRGAHPGRHDNVRRRSPTRRLTASCRARCRSAVTASPGHGGRSSTRRRAAWSAYATIECQFQASYFRDGTMEVDAGGILPRAAQYGAPASAGAAVSATRREAQESFMSGGTALRSPASLADPGK